MIYEIKEITNIEKKQILEFYDNHCDKNISIIKSFLDVDRFSHLITIKDVDKIIGILPVIKSEVGRDYGELTDNHYQFHRVVIHTDYRSQGYCNAILRMGVKLLIKKRADRIRVSKSSLNNVKHTIFTDMKFDLLKYNPEALEFKHIYELDVSKVKNMWSQYE